MVELCVWSISACMCANRHDVTGLYVCYQSEVYVCASGCGIMGVCMSTGCTACLT